MMRGVRRTATGLEMAGTALTAIIAAATVFGFFISMTAGGMQAKQQLQNATPKTRTDSLVGRVAHHDTVLTFIRDTLVAQLRAELGGLRNDVMGLNCQRAGYPSPFCDNVPRVLPPIRRVP
jgi:hypothetical protein